MLNVQIKHGSKNRKGFRVQDDWCVELIICMQKHKSRGEK